jgi:hypothetical protein
MASEQSHHRLLLLQLQQHRCQGRLRLPLLLLRSTGMGRHPGAPGAAVWLSRHPCTCDKQQFGQALGVEACSAPDVAAVKQHWQSGAGH